MTGRLLVIDKQPCSAAMIERIARTLGLEVRILTEPLRAVESFMAFAPDIVILNAITPMRDGIAALQQMIGSAVPAKLIVVSGYSGAYLRLAQGVAKFHGLPPLAILLKPFRQEDLIAQLRAALPAAVAVRV